MVTSPPPRDKATLEISLNEPVVGRFFLNGVWYNVEYEGLHLLCSSCDCYGHVRRSCPSANKLESKVNGAGAKEATEKTPGESLHSAVLDVLAGEDSTPHVTGEIAPDPHGDWLVVKWRNRKQNLGKSLGKGRSSLHNGNAEIREQNQDIQNYSTSGVHIADESRASFKNSRVVRVTPREQEHAAGYTNMVGGHVRHADETPMGSTMDNKKRSRCEAAGARPRTGPAGGTNALDTNAHQVRSAQPSPSLGGPRFIYDGPNGDVEKGMETSVLLTGGTSKENFDSEASGIVIPGKDDAMLFDQSLEGEAMCV
ncbi:uncharacterized protein LOC109790298 [Cajanus cajan]|uniref:uncharacterized protein LOC109790298 n=1 Tax=Cajanus cajan TaxID=3821 RepID=UPI00098DBB42|nr:uncharacterized protein LOC109790298 [Cajanus cajan]